MSFGLPSVKPQPAMPTRFVTGEGPYGLGSVLTHGLVSANGKAGQCHPLEMSEKLHVDNKAKMDMMALRNTQGLHAPLRIAMELKAAKKVGRLPFLPSSNLMLDALTGRDMEIGFEDILNTAEYREQMGQPHAMVEKQLGIL